MSVENPMKDNFTVWKKMVKPGQWEDSVSQALATWSRGLRWALKTAEWKERPNSRELFSKQSLYLHTSSVVRTCVNVCTHKSDKNDKIERNILQRVRTGNIYTLRARDKQKNVRNFTIIVLKITKQEKQRQNTQQKNSAESSEARTDRIWAGNVVQLVDVCLVCTKPCLGCIPSVGWRQTLSMLKHSNNPSTERWMQEGQKFKVTLKADLDYTTPRLKGEKKRK